MKLIAFCEAPADFRLASGLVDRVLREHGPAWLIDNLDDTNTREAVRVWHPDGHGRDYFDIHDLNRYDDILSAQTNRDARSVRVRGHFNGRPGGAGSAMARKAFRIARALHQQINAEPIDAVVLLWDADDQPKERTDGIKAARDEAHQWQLFLIAYGIPDPAREAWILAGFAAADDDEHQRLAALHSELGFSPLAKAHQLRDKAKGALRDIKRVLQHLTANDHHREARCWTDPSLETLHAHGADSGLSAFLHELQAALRPLVAPPPLDD